MGKDNKWLEEVALIKSIIQKSGLQETIKWGTEVYTHNGKNVVGVVGFKNHFTLWFYNGVFLQDKHKVLISAQDGKTKALRQWRFTSMAEINEKMILEYIREAIRNEDAGRVWKPQQQDGLLWSQEIVVGWREDEDHQFRRRQSVRGKDIPQGLGSVRSSLIIL